MKNKVEFKKYLVLVLISSLLLTIVFAFVYSLEYKTYKNNFNYKILEILNVVREKYPDVPLIDLVDVLNSYSHDSKISLEKYGIDIDVDDVVLDNAKSFNVFIIFNIFFFIFCFIIIVFIFLIYIYNKDKKVSEITKLLERINNRDYSLDIDSNTEDELSILKNELYKTTIMLKEQAVIEREGKVSLKNSLEDISHQLKTPLTSIIISLDNIIENPDMSDDVKMKFINSIYREINNISFLVQSILKLSKFDAGTIEFFRKEVFVSDIINRSIDNVILISDLKDVSFDVSISKEAKLFCDSMWQVEAITNILKNAIEHSVNGGVVRVDCSQNKVLTKIIINNNSVISEKDLPNIFKRFYKGKNSNVDSVGIGLSLSKSIIEKDNGKVQVSSNIKEGTTFTIKYYK